MKKTLIILVIMSLCLIGVSLIQINSLNKAYNLRKGELIKSAKQVTTNLKDNFELYFYKDSIKELDFNSIDSSVITQNFDTNQLKDIDFDNWDSIPGDIETKVHNIIDIIFGTIKGMTTEYSKINFDTITQILSKELINKGIETYEYKLYYKDSVIKSNCKTFSSGYMIEEELSSGFFSKNITLKLNLIDIRGIIFSEMKWGMFLPIILLIITIITYITIVKTILKQKKVDEIKNDFIDNITHELKTPISTISLAIEALQNFDGLEDRDKTNRYLNISKNANNRLALLVDRILNITKFERKNIELKKTQFNIATTLSEIKNSVELKLAQKNGKINIHHENNNQTIFGDKEHITTVLYNLIDNAIKYSSSNKDLVIDINCNSISDEIIISIKDNGIGIPNSHLQKIFDKFHRVPNKNIHDVKGFGLGLSYVKSIIELHKGSIEVNSKEKKGSKFTIKLPSHE